MELVLMGLRSLRRERIRSLLTVIGIIIGVATVFTLVSVSIGTNHFLNQEFEKFGADRIIIMPGSAQAYVSTALIGKPFTKEELEAVKKISGVELAAGVGYTSMDVEYKGERKALMVTGAPMKDFRKLFETVQGYELREGRYPRKGKYEAVIGYLTANKLFSKKLKPGTLIRINGRTVKVVGVMEEVGNQIDDYGVIIPYEAFEDLSGRKDVYNMIFVKVSKGANIDTIAEKIKQKLKILRGGENFTVMTSRQLFNRVSTIIGGISLVLIVVAAVSLIVGAIGVMNTMFMSVTERTREIGTLKAVGATKGQILILFLSEAAALGLIGGVIGIGIGTAVAWAVEAMTHGSGITIFHVYLGPDLYIGSLLFSLLIGVLSGYLPAKRAADLDPMEALRYE